MRARGDAALLEYTQRFDRVQAGSAQALEIPKADWHAALAALPAAQRDALQAAAARVRAYHERQRAETWTYTEADGTLLGQQVTPLDRVGLYVPGGKAAYPSSVLMNAIPAKVAGVPELVMVTPTPDGTRNPIVLAAPPSAVWTACSPSAARRPWARWPTAPPPCRPWTRSSAPATPTLPPPSAACSAWSAST